MAAKRKPLLAATSSQSRAAIYIRVSSQMQVDEGFSLEAQRKACRRFAEDRGWQVVDEFEEPGVSAKDDNRPAFQRMIRDAKAGRFDVILTHKLDRFSRSIMDVLTYLRDLHECGVTYVSVTENFDFSTPMGKMQLHMMAAIAQWYLDNLSAETQKGKRTRAEVGYWNGDLPFGYISDEDGNILVHQAEAEGVRLAFRLCGSGANTDLEIAKALNAAGYRTRGKGKRQSRAFSKDTVRVMLRNRFYLGLAKYRLDVGRREYNYFPGKHPALIDDAAWDKAQQARQTRYGRPRTSKSTDRVYPLSGLLRCGECRSPLRGQGQRTVRYYQDPAGQLGKNCSQKATRAELVEKQLVDLFAHIQITNDLKRQVLERLSAETDQKSAMRERTQLTARLERAKQLFFLGDWSEAQYLKEKSAVEADLAQLRPADTVDVEKAAEVLQSLGRLLHKANERETKQFFQLVMDEAFVRNKKVVAIRPKPDYYDLLCMSLADPTGFEPAVSALTGPRVGPATPRIQ